jgi:hypothetical protein
MKTEPSNDQLKHEMVFPLVLLVLGFILILSTKKGTNVFIDPPPWLEPWLGRKSYFWSMLGNKGEKAFYYALGVLFILGGSALILERIVILAHRAGY